MREWMHELEAGYTPSEPQAPVTAIVRKNYETDTKPWSELSREERKRIAGRVPVSSIPDDGEGNCHLFPIR